MTKETGNLWCATSW